MIMHPGVKLRHIRAFLDIAASGNLSASARAQGITQPAPTPKPPCVPMQREGGGRGTEVMDCDEIPQR